MNQIKIRTSLVLACGLAFIVALPHALAGKHSDKDMFKAMDANNDDQVSRAEYAAHGKQKFTDADTSGNGVVTLTEMSAAHDKMNGTNSDKSPRFGQPQAIGQDAQGDKSAAAMIKMHDTNNDGQLSSAEQAKGCDDMFTRMDTNSDGNLSEDECSAGHEAMKKSQDMAASSK